MSIPGLLNPTKCLRRITLISIDKNRFYSLRKLGENRMFTVKNREGKSPAGNLSLVKKVTYSTPSGNPGSGAGKGGGAGGTIKESGGGLGQYAAAQEEQFFFDKQKEQLKEIKKKMLENKKLTQKKEDK